MAPPQAHPQTSPSAADEADLVARLRAADEQAFETLVDRHYGMMLAVARGYVRTRASAEEVLQEAWLGVEGHRSVRGGPSSLKTWIMRIVANVAMSRGEREARSIPFSALASEGHDEPAVDASAHPAATRVTDHDYDPFPDIRDHLEACLGFATRHLSLAPSVAPERSQ